MQYDGEEKLPKHFLVPPPDIERTTGEYLARGCGHALCCGGCAASQVMHCTHADKGYGVRRGARAPGGCVRSLTWRVRTAQVRRAHVCMLRVAEDRCAACAAWVAGLFLV